MIEPNHPEAVCERCGRPNVSWAVDSDRFNIAVAALGLTRTVVICPVCFVEGHEKATAMECSWTLVPASPFRPLDALAAAQPGGNDG